MYEKLKNATVFVTGGAGFIGSHLARRLLELGANVVAFDNLSTGKKENLAECLEFPNFDFFQGDVNVREQVAHVFNHEKFDYVFHGAAVVGVKRVEEDPLAVLRDIDGIRNILELAREQGVKKVVFCSSSEAYGEPQTLPEREDGPINPNPRDPYALTKLHGENLIRIYAEKMGLPGSSLRYFNVYGPRQESSAYGFVTGIFIDQVLQEQNPTIFGDGLQTRDFVYIDDNVEANIRAMISENTGRGEVINVGSGRQTTILDLAEKVIIISGKNPNPVFLPERKIEIRYRAPDITKMRTLLEFTPQVSLDEGLRRTYEWYKNKITNQSRIRVANNHEYSREFVK